MLKTEKNKLNIYKLQLREKGTTCCSPAEKPYNSVYSLAPQAVACKGMAGPSGLSLVSYVSWFCTPLDR